MADCTAESTELLRSRAVLLHLCFYGKDVPKKVDIKHSEIRNDGILDNRCYERGKFVVIFLKSTTVILILVLHYNTQNIKQHAHAVSVCLS